MIPILLKEIRQRRFSLIAYIVGTVAFVWLYVAIFPAIQQQAQNYNKLLETMPKALLEAFGIQTNGLQNIQRYLSTELYSLIWPMLLIFFAVSRAGNLIAGEIERSTLGTLLSQPLSRTKLFIAKYLSGGVSLGLFAGATVLSAIPTAALYHLSTDVKNYFLLLGMGLLFGLTIFSFALMVSALTSDRTKVYGVCGGLLSSMYVLNIVSSINAHLAKFKYASIFHYFSPSATLVNGHVAGSSIWLFSLLIIGFFLLGRSAFKHRDISI